MINIDGLSGFGQDAANQQKSIRTMRVTPVRQVILAFSFFVLCLLGGSGLSRAGDIIDPSNSNPAYFTSLLEEAEQGNAKSQFLLGKHLEEGEGLSRDHKRALEWYMESARQSYPEALGTVGLKFDTGKLVPKNEAEAIKWYEKGVAQDDPWSQTALGYKLLMGKSSHRDLSEGIRLLHLAAEQGEPHAQYYLGICYRDALGVGTDRIQSYLWLNLSAGQKSSVTKEAREHRDKLEKTMIPAQVAEAQQLSTAFVSHKIRTDDTYWNQPRIHAVGTGVFITHDGYLLTSRHVVDEARNITIRTTHGVIPAELVRVDADLGVALLKAIGHFEPLPLRDSRDIQVKMPIKSIRFPHVPLNVAAPLFMEGFVMDVHGFERDPRYFESGIPFQPGTSGTPVLDELGNVIGLGVARQDLAKNYKIMGDLPIKVQYALKIENALPLLRTIPEVASKLSPAISTPDFRREPESIKAASAVVYSWK